MTRGDAPAQEPEDSPDGGTRRRRRRVRRVPDDAPVVPERGADDSDVGWGAQPDPPDDERLLRERPPHW